MSASLLWLIPLLPLLAAGIGALTPAAGAGWRERRDCGDGVAFLCLVWRARTALRDPARI
jgi:hypothetical protein